MMGGGALIPFNGGRPWLESAKQAEIRLAVLLKMLQIAHFRTAAFAGLKKNIRRLHSPLFPRDMANSPGLVALVTKVHSFHRTIDEYRVRKSRKQDL